MHEVYSYSPKKQPSEANNSGGNDFEDLPAAKVLSLPEYRYKSDFNPA